MTPPAGSENQNTLPKAIDTEKLYREMAEQQDPAKLLEMGQQAEKRLVEARHARERAAAAERSAARAVEVLTPTASAAPSSAPSAAPATAPQSSPDKSPESATTPPAAPAENTPATPPSTPTQTPPASPPAASTPPNTPPPTPEAPEGQGWGAKFSEFFNKLWEGLSKVIEGITAKLAGWVRGNKTEQTAETTPHPPTSTPAPAPGVSPPSGPPPPTPERYRDLVKPPDADSTWGLTKGDLFNHPQFKAKTEQIAAKIGGGIVAGDLFDIFMMESIGQPQNPPSRNGAAGLLQWIPTTARSLYSLSTEQIRRMSGLQQLDLVDRYFSPYAGQLHSFSDLYRTVFYPVSIGKPPDFIFGSESKNPEWKVEVAKSNPGISRFGTVPATLNGQQVMINRNINGKRQDMPLKLIDNRALEKYCASRRGKGSSLVRGGSPSLIA